jgi:hypothetical protein
MKKFVAGGLLILSGVTAAVVTTFETGEETGKYNLCYIVVAGDSSTLRVGQVLEARADLTKDFSPIEKGEGTLGLTIRLTVRTVAITEAQAISINAGCDCFKVNDLESPTGLEAL